MIAAQDDAAANDYRKQIRAASNEDVMIDGVDLWFHEMKGWEYIPLRECEDADEEWFDIEFAEAAARALGWWDADAA